MTHFLSRLVARARGTAPRVEPLVTSRFAPATAGEEMIPPEEIAGATERPAVPPAPMSTRAAGARNLPTGTTAKTASRENAGQASRSASSSEAPGFAEDTNLDAQPEPLLVPLHNVGERSAASESLRPKPTASPHFPEDRALQPMRRNGSARQDVDGGSSSEQAPIVRVTIGRIEVRAAPAAAAPPRRAAKRAAGGPTLTLDAYLKARRGNC
jgi:hypothetical protein